MILLSVVLAPEAASRSADTDSCHEVKTAYMMRQIGPVELVPDRARAGQSLPEYIFTIKCHRLTYQTHYLEQTEQILTLINQSTFSCAISILMQDFTSALFIIYKFYSAKSPVTDLNVTLAQVQHVLVISLSCLHVVNNNLEQPIVTKIEARHSDIAIVVATSSSFSHNMVVYMILFFI